MNAIGLYTLFRREVRRFLTVPGQTLAQPIVATSLFLIVFGHALGSTLRAVGGLPYPRFIVPGLIVLGVVQNAFLNSASSLFVAKLQGTMIDLLVAPLSAAELLIGYCGGAMVRGLLVGTVTWGVAAGFHGVHVAHPFYALAVLLLVALAFSALGVIVAVRSDKFEQLNAVPAFVLTPLTFFGGAFYDAATLPPPWHALVHADPIFYLVDGMRWAIEDRGATSPLIGLSVAAGLALSSSLAGYLLLERGDKLRT